MRRLLILPVLMAFQAVPASGSAQTPSAELHKDIGNSLCRRGRHAEAIRSYREAIRVRPAYAEAHTGLGVALLKLNRFDDAARSFRAVVKLQPSNGRAHYDLGLALTAMRRHESALGEYREALRLAPPSPEARVAILATLAELGRADEAMVSLTGSPAKPSDPVVHMGSRARSAALQGRHVDAVLLWTQALEANPGYFEGRPEERQLWDRSVSFVRANRSH